MKRRILIGAAVVVTIAIVVAVGYRLIVPPQVMVAEAVKGELVETLVVTGQVEPWSRTALTAEVAAPIEEVTVEQGDEVEEGEVLVRFDDQEGRLALRQAEAAVDEARARLDSVVEQGAPTALEDLREAEIVLEGAEQEYQRAQRLFEEGLITESEVDEQRRQVERARSRVDRAQTAYREATADGSAHDEVAAMLERAHAERELARHRLERYTVRAPADAMVLGRNVEPGSAVQPGQALVVIAPDGPLDIRIEPDEREMARLEPGQPAWAVADAYPQHPLTATVRRIDPSVDPERGTITAHLRVDDRPAFLRPDMTVTVDIELTRRDDALAVPRVAVRDLATDTPRVLRIEDRRARAVEVEVGIRGDRYVEVTEGIEDGDIVIADAEVEKGDRVRPGVRYEMAPDREEDREDRNQAFEPPIADAHQEMP